MGYYTYYSLEIEGSYDNSALAADFNQLTDINLEHLSEDTYKWYDWSEDMSTLSKSYPSLLFTLYGDGEDADDHWVAYIHNGHVQQECAVLVYPKMDPSKLNNIDKNHPELFI